MQSAVQDKNLEAQFFDQFSAEGYTVFTEEGYARFLAEFLRLTKPAPGDTVFDFGCGTGAFTKYLAAHGFRVIGFDLSPGCVARARTDVPAAHFEIGDIEHLSAVGPGIADIIVFSAVLHHLPSRQPALREAWRILKPRGRVFAFDPNVRNPAMFLYRDRRSPLYSSRGVTANEQPLRREALVADLKQAGFNDIQCNGISGVPFSYIESPLARLFLPIYNAFDRVLDATPLASSLGAFLVTVGKKPSPL